MVVSPMLRIRHQNLHERVEIFNMKHDKLYKNRQTIISRARLARAFFWMVHNFLCMPQSVFIISVIEMDNL